MINETKTTGITIRRLGAADEAAIERLIQLESGTRPTGSLMGAEIEGRLLVATSIETGKSVADPFSRTKELQDLIGVRIAQLNGHEPRRKRLGRSRGRSRGAIGSSPPGAGGKLLQLPVRMG